MSIRYRSIGWRNRKAREASELPSVEQPIDYHAACDEIERLRTMLHEKDCRILVLEACLRKADESALTRE